jgi:hypothetical protein
VREAVSGRRPRTLLEAGGRFIAGTLATRWRVISNLLPVKDLA